jgi:hypothetical protein
MKLSDRALFGIAGVVTGESDAVPMVSTGASTA